MRCVSVNLAAVLLRRQQSLTGAGLWRGPTLIPNCCDILQTVNGRRAVSSAGGLNRLLPIRLLRIVGLFEMEEADVTWQCVRECQSARGNVLPMAGNERALVISVATVMCALVTTELATKL